MGSRTNPLDRRSHLVAFTAGLLYSDGLTLQQVRNRNRASVKLARPPLSGDVRTEDCSTF